MLAVLFGILSGWRGVLQLSLCKEEWVFVKPIPDLPAASAAQESREIETTSIAAIKYTNRISRHWPESP